MATEETIRQITRDLLYDPHLIAPALAGRRDLFDDALRQADRMVDRANAQHAFTILSTTQRQKRFGPGGDLFETPAWDEMSKILREAGYEISYDMSGRPGELRKITRGDERSVDIQAPSPSRSGHSTPGGGRSTNTSGHGRGKNGTHMNIIKEKAKRRQKKEIDWSTRSFSKPAIRRLARRGGVKRISSLMHEEVRGIMKEWLNSLLRLVLIYTESRRAKTVNVMDVVMGLKKIGMNFYAAQEINFSRVNPEPGSARYTRSS